jgi:hypothetical protein
MRLLNDEDLTSGIEHNIWRAIVSSIDNNSEETFLTLNHFVRNILQLSIREKSLTHFQRYIFFPANYYNTAFNKKINDSSLENIYKLCASHAALHLKEIIWSDIGVNARKAGDAESKRLINHFYKWAFNGFSRLYYLTIKNNDIKQFSNEIDEFDQISNIGYGNSYDLKYKIKNFERENIDGKNNEEIKHLKEEYNVLRQFETLSRHTLLGIKYWIIFLFRVGKLNEDTTVDLINLIRVDYSDAEDALNDILFFRGNELIHYMGWDDWDYLDRKPMKVYSPPNTYEWLTFGFLVDQIRDNRLLINVDELGSEELDNVKFLFNALKENINILESDFPKWAKILQVNDISTFQEKTKNILNLFAALKRKSLGRREKEIASTPLSSVAIEGFRQIVGQAWKSQARISRLFKEKGIREQITDDNIKLKHIGQRTFFEKAKMMFIEGENHQDIYGIERMGGQIGRWEDTEFFTSILKSNPIKLTSTSITQLLNKSIAELKSKDIVPDLILIAPEYSYKDKELLNSKLFKPNTNNVSDENALSFFEIGTFDGVPIFSSFSEVLRNRALVCNFKNAFKMRYKTNPDWYENELTIDVNEVSIEEAQRRLMEQPEKWKKTEEGAELRETDALTLIKTSVNIDIWTTIDFLIQDKDSFIFGNIKTEITSEERTNKII